jgi:hypothetical protein
MPKMAISVCGPNLGARHTVTVVYILDNVVRFKRLCELDHPEWLSNLSVEANKGSPDTTST